MRLAGLVPAGPRREARAAVALLTSVAVVAGGCAGSRREIVQAGVPATEAPAAFEGPERTGVRHVVRAGQTLWRIARVYGVTVDEIARINGIDDPTSLAAGRVLFVPGATAVLDVPPYPAPLPGDERDVATPVEPRFAWPVANGRILSGYGAPRRTHRHRGIDIAGRRGEPVLAAAAGLVVYCGATLRGYGKTVIIDHGDELGSLYAHNSDLVVREGDRVERGDVIARLGRTGNASAEHCHFEIRRNDVPVDPMPYLTRDAEDTR